MTLHKDHIKAQSVFQCDISARTALALSKIVDDGTTTITIPTPKGWKCKRKGCRVDYKHSHGIYTSLK